MIDVDETDGVTRLTLARPEKANALTRGMLEDLRDAVRAARTPVLVLTGAGGVFSAGMDLAAAGEGLATAPVWEELSGAIARFPGLSIAALNGTAAGGALGMVLACDLRVAVPGARVFYPVMRLGFLPQPSDPRRMAALIGAPRAKRILMAGEKIDAGTARDWGLFDSVAEDPLAQAEAWSAAARAAKPGHAAAIKALFD
ncbi:MAG: enoyl-CoA hydratase/isomerase family protein [Pseudomonadota bacterium]